MIYIPLERVKRFGKNLNTDLNPVLLTLSLFYVFSETCCTVNIVQIYLKFLKQESFESQLSSAQLIIQRFENDIVCIQQQKSLALLCALLKIKLLSLISFTVKYNLKCLHYVVHRGGKNGYLVHVTAVKDLVLFTVCLSM